MDKLSVIVPIYNEEEFLESSVVGLAPRLDEIVAPHPWEFVFVNKGCTDQSAQVIEKLCARWPSSRMIHLDRADYGEALKHGLENAAGDFAFLINVDAWDPKFLARAWPLRARHELILGSKRLNPDACELHAYRKILSWGLNLLLAKIFGFEGTDTHGQKLLNLAPLRPLIGQTTLRRGQFDTELTLRAQRLGFRTAELPISIREYRKPRNSMLRKISRNLVDVIRLHRALRHIPLSPGGARHTRYFP